MTKKIVKLTETDLINIVKRVISEGGKPTGKLYFAHDDGITQLQGIIGTDGYLYPYGESLDTWKVGPIAKVPYTGDVIVKIDKRGGKEEIWVGKSFNNLGKLEMVPNYAVKTVNHNTIPRPKK
jgi:hypothetical protein